MMAKEVRDIYLFVLGLKKSIKDLAINPQNYQDDLFYKGNIVECRNIVDFLSENNVQSNK